MSELNMDEINRQIDEWVEKTKKLTGTEVRERETWNTDVTPDTIRHFCYGTDDDNLLCRKDKIRQTHRPSGLPGLGTLSDSPWRADEGTPGFVDRRGGI